MVQWVRLFKHENLSLDASTHAKTTTTKPKHAMYVPVTPVLRGMETGGSPELSGC